MGISWHVPTASEVDAARGVVVRYLSKHLPVLAAADVDYGSVRTSLEVVTTVVRGAVFALPDCAGSSGTCR